ncbi:hypothetical protein EDB89DRAFT_2064260 [Lactarius sanguifluus]|nr:hypothetical protein EDB89DRAFT_2064260 [Lactarius sanguifluus]
MARQDWDIVQDPANLPRPFNVTCKAPATTDPHATSTWRATPRHPQTQCHTKTRPPPTCHVAPTCPTTATLALLPPVLAAPWLSL